MSITVNVVIDALLRHKNVLLYGPPGTGKSHLMNEVKKNFRVEDESLSASTAVLVDTDAETVPLVTASTSGVATRWVTFHQGYSYEDFVLGLRPQNDGGALFSLVPLPGVLLELAAEAQVGASLLLIDEINRGNTSRIFGEFITLMEPEKRLNKEGQATATTITLVLPYLAPGEVIAIQTSANEERLIERNFAMPAELYTLASMNSVDKSIAPIDTALRRRFHVINLFPSSADLRLAVGLSTTDSVQLDPLGSVTTPDGIARLAVSVMEKLNRSIGLHLGQDFMLGQWYLQGVRANTVEAASDVLVETWLFRFVPQLVELFHGRMEVLIELLNLEEDGQGSGFTVYKPSSVEAEAGAIAYLTTSEPAPTNDDVIEFLQRFAGAPEPVLVAEEA